MSSTLFIFSALIGLVCFSNTIKSGEKIVEKKQVSDTSKKSFSYIALGDSYTIGESVDSTDRFPEQLKRKLESEGLTFHVLKVIAQTGWTTDELSAAIKDQQITETFDLVTLLIGVNNQYRGRDAEEYRLQLKELLQTSVRFAGGDVKRVIVVSIPDYGVTPFANNRNPQKIAREINLYNKIKKEETAKIGAGFIDITAISRKAKNNAKLIAKDGLHPSAQMYGLWADEILPLAKQILDK